MSDHTKNWGWTMLADIQKELARCWRQSGKRFLLVLQPRAYASLRSEVLEQIPLPLKGLKQATETDFSRRTIGGIPFVVGEEVSGREIPDWFLLEVKEQ